jgi:ribosome-interacting GTPase 1
MKLNIDYMLETIWKLLNLIRVYTKKRGEKPDFEGGLIIRSGTTVEHVVSFFVIKFFLSILFDIVSYSSSNNG